MRFKLIDAAKKEFPVQRLCKVLEVSPSGYFAWKSRPASQRQREDLVLLAHVRSAFALSNGTYGSPRMTRELQDPGLDGGAASDGAADARERAQSPAAAPLQAHHRQPACLPGRAQPPRPGLLGRAPRREVGRRHQLRLDPGGLAVPGRCHGPVLPGAWSAGRSATGCTRSWRSPRCDEPSSIRRPAAGLTPSFGPRRSILLHRVPGRAAAPRHPDLDVRQGELLRQLHGRDVLQDAEERAGLAHRVPDPGRGARRPGPLHRRLLQSGPAPLGAGLRQPRPVRKAHRQPNRSPLKRGKSTGGEGNGLIGHRLGERWPAIDLSHRDLARGEQRPEQHGGGVCRGQDGLGLDPALELLVQPFDGVGGPGTLPLARW